MYYYLQIGCVRGVPTTKTLSNSQTLSNAFKRFQTLSNAFKLFQTLSNATCSDKIPCGEMLVLWIVMVASMMMTRHLTMNNLRITILLVITLILKTRMPQNIPTVGLLMRKQGRLILSKISIGRQRLIRSTMSSVN